MCIRDRLYTQLFQQLYYQADIVHGGRLPVHVHFVMDEFANVALPDEFDKLLATMRSREISVSIIIQNLAQLKALFEKQWESIVGNCDAVSYTHLFCMRLQYGELQEFERGTAEALHRKV